MQIEGKLQSWRSLSSWVARWTDLTKMQTCKEAKLTRQRITQAMNSESKTDGPG